MSSLAFQEIPESRMTFDLPDTDLQISGRLCGSLDGPMVVGLHGLGDNGNELIQHITGQALHAAGFNSLWLSLYGYDASARNLHDCTFDTHIDDFEVVVGALQDAGIKDIYATGHSAGGLVVLMSKAALKGAVILDGSHGKTWEGRYDELGADAAIFDDNYVCYLGPGYTYPMAMARQMASLGDTTQLAADKDYPLKFIVAGNGVLVEAGQAYYQAANEPKAIHVIDGAGHMMDESARVVLEMAHETVQWFVEIENGDIRQDER